MTRWWLLLAFVWAPMGCDDDGAVDGGVEPVEAGVDGAIDLGADAETDGEAPVDAGPDAVPADGEPDGQPADAAPADAAPVDGAVDAMPDGAPLDAAADAAPDMLPPDMLPPDLGPPDLGPPPACGHPRSECAEDADCGAGTCRPLPDDPRAPCVCVGPRPQPVRAFCQDGGPFESECCADDECDPPAMGVAVCQQSVYGPQNDYCGGAAPPEENRCVADGCFADSDCSADEACMPPGAFGFVVGACRPAPCRHDGECDARPGGECRPYFSRCISASFGCSYPDSPCRVDADCPVGRFGDRQSCVPTPDGDTACREFLPAP